MGNQVGVCREPPQLAELFPLSRDEYNEHGAAMQEDAGGFRSYIQMWRFYTDSGDDMFIKNSPVKLGAFKKFDSRDCYIALHIFKNYGDSKYNVHPHEPSSPGTSYSLHELVVSSIEELTPRGIASSFGTLTLEPFIHTTRDEYTHDLYVWNGKASTPLAKAVALAKGFEIERVLVKEKTTGTVYRRFARGPKSSLSSIFMDDFDEGKGFADTKKYDVNHLFRQLMSPHKRPSTIKIGELFGNHQADLPRFEVLTRKKFEPGTSTPPASRSAELPRPKVPILSLKELPAPTQQLRLEDATPRPKVPPIFIKAMTEGNLILPPFYKNISDPTEFDEREYSTMEPSKLLYLFEPLLSRILDFLFLSSRIPTANKDLLRQNGISHILNCAGDHCTNHFPDDFNYKTYYISDSSGEDITCLFYETIDFIEDARLHGGSILIHCSQGVSRSSSFVILYLMWQFRWDFNKAHAWVRKIRFISNPNPGFTGQLMQWYKRTAQLPSRNRASLPPPSHIPIQPPAGGPWTLPLATPRNSRSPHTPRGHRNSSDVPSSLAHVFDNPPPAPRSPTFSSVFDNPPLTPRSPTAHSPAFDPPLAPRNHHTPSSPLAIENPPLPPRPTTPGDPTPTPRGEPPLRTITIPTNKINASTPTPGEPPPNNIIHPPSPPSIPTFLLHQPKSLTRVASDPTPTTHPRTPPTVQLYRMVAHSHCAFVVPKALGDSSSLPQFPVFTIAVDPFNVHALDPRGCFALCTPHAVFMWIGMRCPQTLLDGARRAVEKLQRYECASSRVEDIHQGHELPLFWDFFTGGVGDVVENPAYVDYLLPNPN
eukprot:Phypoly_transcript_03038.p1 GENE.Phypoly_transcript_03038~~Phypoly_transcript_03038.p1  ORF type:complete len:836 (+),score=135.47 Phypoly_transcript_03038:48-2510(+)